jgi:hypothetical protein
MLYYMFVPGEINECDNENIKLHAIQWHVQC